MITTMNITGNFEQCCESTSTVFIKLMAVLFCHTPFVTDGTTKLKEIAFNMKQRLRRQRFSPTSLLITAVALQNK